MTFPRVAVLHIAHSSRYVPPAARRAICLDDAALAGELLDCDRGRSLLGRRFVRQHSSRIAAGPVDGRGTGKPFNFHCQPVCNPSNSVRLSCSTTNGRPRPLLQTTTQSLAKGRPPYSHLLVQRSPRVPVPKLRVVSLSPTLARRDLTLCRP